MSSGAPGPAFWLVLAIGLGARAFLVIATQGTHDVVIWQSHAGWIHEYGLLGYYARSEVFNHPPLVAKLMHGLWDLARALGIGFPVLLRAPFALLDLGSALLLRALFRDSPRRDLVFAAYWLHPLALIFSAFHGNTDSAVAFFALLALFAAVRGRAAAAGAALGLGLGIKLPVAIAVPGLLFAWSSWRRRGAFLGALGAVAAVVSLPELARAPGLLFERVLGYGGARIETPGGAPIWGIANVLGVGEWVPDALNTPVCLAAVVLFAWLRRRETGVAGLGATLCGSFVILYGATQLWAFQYLAWSVPFWFFAPLPFAAAASLFVGGYVYGAYALLCHSPFLLGRWRFGAYPDWPVWLLFLRDASVLLCFGSACAFLGAALRRAGWRGRPSSGVRACA